MRNLMVICSMIIFLVGCQPAKSESTENESSQKMTDSVYVLKNTTETSELYTLYYNDGSSLKKIYEIQTEDESSLSYMYSYDNNGESYKCFILNNNSADCNRFIFFNNKDKKFYITTACFSGFYPQKDFVDFDKGTLILYNDKGDKDIVIDEKVKHVPYNDAVKTIKSNLELLQLETKDAATAAGGQEAAGSKPEFLRESEPCYGAEAFLKQVSESKYYGSNILSPECKMEYYHEGKPKKTEYFLNDEKGYYTMMRYPYQMFDKDGHMIGKVAYTDLRNGLGAPYIYEKYFASGTVESRDEVEKTICGRTHKKIEKYHPSGTLKEIIVFRLFSPPEAGSSHDLIDIGEIKEYFPGGKLKSVTKWHMSSPCDNYLYFPCGEWIYYNEDGSVLKKEGYASCEKPSKFDEDKGQEDPYSSPYII